LADEIDGTRAEVKKMRSITEIPVATIASVRFVVDPTGNKTDVVVPWAAWQELLAWLEEADDRAVVREWLPRLKAGPTRGGALRWSDIADEWDED
jgi:hypothetical protein